MSVAAAAARPALDIAYVAPRDDTEARVAGLWEQVLRIAPLGVDDDYFELGGESLQAFALIARIREGFGVVLTPRDFFAAGTIAGMATMIRERTAAR